MIDNLGLKTFHMPAIKLYSVTLCFAFFFKQLNWHELSLRIRFAFADHLFTSEIFYVNKNPLEISTATLNGCVQRL